MFAYFSGELHLCLGMRRMEVGLVALAVFPIRQGDGGVVLKVPHDSAVCRTADEKRRGSRRAAELNVIEQSAVLNLVRVAFPGGMNTARGTRA